jgi:hypothetical protein
VTDKPDNNQKAGNTEKPLHDPQNLKAELLRIAREIKANMPDDVTSDHGWLYDDETGLPR